MCDCRLGRSEEFGGSGIDCRIGRSEEFGGSEIDCRIGRSEEFGGYIGRATSDVQFGSAIVQHIPSIRTFRGRSVPGIFAIV